MANSAQRGFYDATLVRDTAPECFKFPATIGCSFLRWFGQLLGRIRILPCVAITEGLARSNSPAMLCFDLNLFVQLMSTANKLLPS